VTEWIRVVVVGLNLLVSVVDGDTVRRDNGDLVRLRGFNTPELRGKCEGERFKARLARDRLAQILAQPGATLTIFPEQCGHGRHCGKITVNDQDAKDTLISEGLAEPMECPDGKCPNPRDWCKG
jgi:endonuclease YncB( thermonuclease family)